MLSLGLGQQRGIVAPIPSGVVSVGRMEGKGPREWTGSIHDHRGEQLYKDDGRADGPGSARARGT